MIARYYKVVAPMALMLSGLFSCSESPGEVCIDGAVWNTTYSIKYQGDASLVDSVHVIMRDVELSLSPFNRESLISAVNSNRSQAVDSNIRNVFNISQRVNVLSCGAFDPTLSPLINLWGFGFGDQKSTSPDDAVIDSVLATVGIADCHIVGDSIVKKHPDTTFNFSAVTKGYGCDMIAAMFRRNGVGNYLIEIGGEIALNGHNRRGKPWRVMIDAPVDSVAGHRGLLTIEPGQGGVATSGNYRNYRDMPDGRRIGHTISAVTGRPVVTNTLSATVIAPDCATADALATACMAMHPDSAVSMIRALPATELILVTLDADDCYKVMMTDDRYIL
ncbi:MAG: FAD:protein FMN transferase [Muribaculaceae bacterium]|nr:FAD:protein FMN transferase [Muribaculaceae bacterium]